VEIVPPSGRPPTEIAPRATVTPLSALDSSLLTGLLDCPEKSRGAAASITVRIALSATAVGATTKDVRVTGFSGGISANAGREPVSVLGQNVPVAHKVAVKETTTTKAPVRILRMTAIRPPFESAMDVSLPIFMAPVRRGAVLSCGPCGAA
jgi:hypothetical protein